MFFPRLHRICKSAVLNNVPYCDHERDICHVCCQSPSQALAPRIFKLPDSGQPQYPAGLALIQDPHLRSFLGQRWLHMQEALFSPQTPLTMATIKLPSVAAEPSLQQVLASPITVHTWLLQRFQQLQVMAATQRYFFATQTNILLNEYDTFAQAIVLYERELSDIRKCAMTFYSRELGVHWRSKASIVTTLGYFLGLETHRAFWRVMEMTMEAYVKYLENYDEALDSQVVMEDKAKTCLLDCIAHVFWSLQHAQYRVDQLRRQQHVNFQHEGPFPFYPYRDRAALEANLDIHVLVTKLSRASIYDFPSFSFLFSAFRLAADFTEQMQDVNTEIMAAIDELSARFRVLELLILAAATVATHEEIKTAIVRYEFDPDGKEVTSLSEDLACRCNNRPKPLPTQNLSLLQMLLVKAAHIRRNHLTSFMCGPLLVSEELTNVSFEAFKNKYSYLYHGTFRPAFRHHERSLLPLHAVCRFQHRKEIAKKKKKQQRALTAQDKLRADIVEDRMVPEAQLVNASLLWEFGDQSIEKYMFPVVREKIKTRKQGDGRDSGECSLASPRSSTEDESEQSDKATCVCRPVKDSDLKTRDILWRKVKGILKWSNFVQFLTQLGCKVQNLDGSKKKVIDSLTGRSAVIHRPHPGDDCRPDQRDSYRVHLEDWLHINFSDVVPAEDIFFTQSPAAIP